MKEALTKLLKIKSIVTILLTLAFVFGALYQQIQAQPLPDALVNIYRIKILKCWTCFYKKVII